jgi:hypothetical protein
VPLYPATPLVFLGTSLFMLHSTLTYAGVGSLLGIAVMLVGVPVLALARQRPTITAAAAAAEVERG